MTEERRCSGCEERSKMMQEAWEAARAGDLKAYQEKMQALLRSSVDSLLGSIRGNQPSVEPPYRDHQSRIRPHSTK